MGEWLGYLRVSTKEQKLDLQRDALLAAGVDARRLYDDIASGAKQARPGLAACLKALRAGDTLGTDNFPILIFGLSELALLTQPGLLIP
jgi:DNA invertase Pin-like site-specific DNA recombinase